MFYFLVRHAFRLFMLFEKITILKARFHYEREKKALFVSFIDLRLKQAVKIEVSAKKNQ